MLVPLSCPPPPQLEPLIGYSGRSRYLILYTNCEGRSCWADRSEIAPWRTSALALLREHPAIRCDLPNSNSPHSLLYDRAESKLSFGSDGEDATDLFAYLRATVPFKLSPLSPLPSAASLVGEMLDFLDRHAPVEVVLGFPYSATGRCDLEIRPQRDRAIVIVTEPPLDPIAIPFKDLFLKVCRQFALNPEQVVWIEHWPACKEQDSTVYCLVTYTLDNERPLDPQWQQPLGATKEEALNAVRGVLA